MKKACTLALLLLTFAAQGQQPTHDLDQVVITANKFNQKASETGKVMSIISREEIDHSSGRTLLDLLNSQPGLTISGAGRAPANYPSVYLRGANVKYTLIMIDGVPVQDASPDNVQFDLNLIPLAAVERIEILRGGYGSLYGSGAAAGVINIITRQGGDKPFGASLGLQGGSYGTLREDLAAYGTVNKTDYNVQLQRLDSDGFSDALDSLGHQGYDHDGFHRSAIFANLGLHPGDHWTLRPFFRYTREKGDLDGGAFTDDKDYTYSSWLVQTGAQASHSFTGGDLHVQYSYNPVDRHYLNDTADHSSFLRSGYSSRIHFLEAYAHFTLGKRLSALAGLSGEFMKTDQEQLSISAFGPYETKLSGDSAHINSANAYGSLFFQTPSGLHVELGGRLHRNNLYGFHPLFSFNPSWLIHNKTKVFINLASSFSAPSLYQLYSEYGHTALNPEQGMQYEGGVEWGAGTAFSTRVTLFARTMKDVIAFQLVDPDTYRYQYVNYDHQHDHGGELELRYTGAAWKLRAWYAYADGKITVLNEATHADSTYHNLFKRPRHTAGLAAGYQLSPAFYLSLDGQYTGLRKDLVFLGNSSAVRDLDAYVLLNAYAQYVLKGKYKIFASIHNLTDSHYTEVTGFATRGFSVDAGIQLSL